MPRAQYSCIFWAIITNFVFCVSAYAELGFYPLSDSSVPEKVRLTQNSVFRLSNPNGEVFSMENAERSSSYEEAIDLLREIQPIYSVMLEQCKPKPFRKCEVLNGISVGTAFVTGAGDELWTAFHNIKVYLAFALKKAGIDRKTNPLAALEFVKTVDVPMVLEANDSTINFDTNMGDKATIAFIDPSLIDLNWEGSLNSFDYVKFKLSKTVGPELNMDTTAIPVGEPLYTIGYPKLTEDRSSFGKPDSDGTNILVTKGVVLSFEQADQNLNRLLTAIYGEVAKMILGEKTILGDNDGVQGLSGAPLLDTNGNVHGIFTSSYPYFGQADQSKTTFSVKFDYILDRMADIDIPVDFIVEPTAKSEQQIGI